MIVSFAFVVWLFFVVLIVWLRLRTRRPEHKWQIEKSLRPVNMSALRGFMNRDDEKFLREKLSRTLFFRIKRRRIRVVWGYLRRIAWNSRAVMRGAASLRRNADDRVAEAAREAKRQASQVYRQCLLAFAKTTVEYMFPAISFKDFGR